MLRTLQQFVVKSNRPRIPTPSENFFSVSLPIRSFLSRSKSLDVVEAACLSKPQVLLLMNLNKAPMPHQ